MNLKENILSLLFILLCVSDYYVHVICFSFNKYYSIKWPYNVILYSDDDERNNIAVNYINNGLKSGYQCIYASIDAYDSTSSSNISNLSSKIYNYKENIESGELKIVNFKPYYESALHGDLSSFNKLKAELEETLNHRKSEGKKDGILAFGCSMLLITK